ncbi:hypothetical protein VKT23_004724 [Stygiomarasmius scandens]|uniref:RBR-type E3 ubiquitin transferase n=1 Tax=Marasmiellus scandens TaxID=2682957 RepID=A0ABR1JV11_9AGAR
MDSQGWGDSTATSSINGEAQDKFRKIQRFWETQGDNLNPRCEDEHQETEEQRRREEDSRARREAETEHLRRIEEARREEDRAHREAEAERLRIEAARHREEEDRIRRKAEVKAERLRLIEEALRQANEAAEKERRDEQRLEKVRREARDRLDAAKTTQHLVLGTTIVKFSAGVNIDHIITGFDSCRVRITNLPLDAQPHEISNLLLDQGMNEDMFQVVSIEALEGRKEADFIVEGEWGRVIALGIDGIDFRGEALTVEASDSGTLEGMDSNDSSVLTVTWRIPSERFIVTYAYAGDAIKKNALNGRIFNGQKISVERYRSRDRNRPGSYSLLVSGVPLGTPAVELQELFDTLTIRKLPTILFDEPQVERLLRLHIRVLALGKSVNFEEPQLDQGDCSLRVRFKNWEDAKGIYNQLVDRQFAFIGNATFGLNLPEPYEITIPIRQYRSQVKQWDSFLGDTRDSTLRIRIRDDKAILRVGGDDLKAVGMLKVRVESLVSGTVLQKLSHAWFGTEVGQMFLESVYAITGAYAKYDWRLKVLRVFGDQATITEARTMIEEKIVELSSLEHTEIIRRKLVRFFVQRGVDVLKEAFGEDSVTLDISTPPVRITIRGGEEAQHLLRKLKDESLLNTTKDFPDTTSAELVLCPICLMQVSNSVRLGCGHEYCTACIRHFFTADVKNFPLVCIGDEGECRIPIALPMIEKFLTPSQFTTLLETAFTAHIQGNPQLYRYCKTPDCRQIYRCDSSSPTARQCPSCFASICLGCHEEGHEGITCEERRIQLDPAEQERLNDTWARETGVKRCPQCQVWIEKTEGCNHMKCRCGAHICWVCMGIFAQGMIYAHMNQAHGGIHDDGIIGNEQIPAQLEAFRAFEDQRIAANNIQFHPPGYVIHRYDRNEGRQNRPVPRPLLRPAIREHNGFHRGLEGRLRQQEEQRQQEERLRQQEEQRRQEERQRQEEEQQQREQEEGNWQCILM